MKSLITLTWLALVGLGLTHMALDQPYPRGSAKLAQLLGDRGQIDYSLTSPAQSPCQGKPPNSPVQTFQAGQSITATFRGGANHGGGHCQFAVSYDQQKTWLVLHTVLDTCLVDKSGSYQVRLPASTPYCEHCVFAWTWINRMGNREYYWNCVDARIEGPSHGQLIGPQLLIANIMGQPIIPEWNGKDKIGIQLLQNRPDITISK